MARRQVARQRQTVLSRTASIGSSRENSSLFFFPSRERLPTLPTFPGSFTEPDAVIGLSEFFALAFPWLGSPIFRAAHLRHRIASHRNFLERQERPATKIYPSRLKTPGSHGELFSNRNLLLELGTIQ
jgi:hypothetical protein